MVDKLGGVSSANFGNPRLEINNQVVMASQAAIDETDRDLFGVGQKITKQEFEVISERFKEKLLSSLNDFEIAERLSKQGACLRELTVQTTFNRNLVITTVEKVYKILLGLPEEATRDEIKEAIKPYLQ